MKLYQRYFLFSFHVALFLFGIAIMPACSFSSQKETSLQDTTKAGIYFEEHLSFTTNPYAINSFLSDNLDVLIIDVRDSKSFADGHIPKAVNVPFGKDVVSLKQLDRNKFTYVYCYDELCNLAPRVAKDLADAGYPVKIIRGGYIEWKKQGFAIEQS